MERRSRATVENEANADVKSWSSICTGATLWGLENSSGNALSRGTVQSRISRHSYGLCFALPFDKTKGHLEVDRVRGTKGEWRAREQMGWLLRKVSPRVCLNLPIDIPYGITECFCRVTKFLKAALTMKTYSRTSKSAGITLTFKSSRRPFTTARMISLHHEESPLSCRKRMDELQNPDT